MFISQSSIRLIVQIYLGILLTLITVGIVLGAIRLGSKDTIVVDASDYIKQELKASQEIIKQKDLAYTELYLELASKLKEIDSIKVTLKSRQYKINQLKQQLNETPNPINYSSDQHDSLFTEFTKG